MGNDEIELPDHSYSVSVIQYYIEYFIKKNKTLTTIPTTHVYINRINNRSVFKIKDGYKQKVQTPETMKLFCSTNKSIDKTKKSIEVVEVVLVQCNLADNQYQYQYQ